jgi:hypothetical protein
MPGMDGVAFFEAMRKDLGERCPKVLFIDDLWKLVREVLAN